MSDAELGGSGREQLAGPGKSLPEDRACAIRGAEMLVRRRLSLNLLLGC